MTTWYVFKNGRFHKIMQSAGIALWLKEVVCLLVSFSVWISLHLSLDVQIQCRFILCTWPGIASTLLPLGITSTSQDRWRSGFLHSTVSFPPLIMFKAIGIDLGTTDWWASHPSMMTWILFEAPSCVGVWQNYRVEIIANEQGNRTTPSYVSFSDIERRIGDAAKNQVVMNPHNTYAVYLHSLLACPFSTLDNSVFSM